MSLEDLNKEFREQYKIVLESWRKEQDYIIIATVSSLTLMYKGAELENHKTTSNMYNDLKNVSHIPITVYLLIKNRDPLTNNALEQYKQRLDDLQLSVEIESNHGVLVKEVINKSKTILSEAINNKELVDQGKLVSLCRSLRNEFSDLLDAAAINQLNLLDMIVQNWLKYYNIDRHNSSAKVLIMCPRPARQNNLQATYFERLFGMKHAREFFCVEDIFNESTAIKIFSTWFYDEQIGDAFFNDPSRMYRDLLVSERVREHIKELLP